MPHSYLSAATGSTFAARRAGMWLAMAGIVMSVASTPKNVLTRQHSEGRALIRYDGPVAAKNSEFRATFPTAPAPIFDTRLGFVFRLLSGPTEMVSCPISGGGVQKRTVAGAGTARSFTAAASIVPAQPRFLEGLTFLPLEQQLLRLSARPQRPVSRFCRNLHPPDSFTGSNSRGTAWPLANGSQWSGTIRGAIPG